MTLDEIKRYVVYNPILGTLETRVEGRPNRLLFLNESNQVTTSLPCGMLKIKANKLVWWMVHGKKPSKDEVVHHLDLDETNLRLNNLTLISKKDYLKVIEALKNLSGNLRLIPHPTDVFTYLLEYKENGRLKRQTILDVTIAKKKLLKMQLKFIKFIGKYTITD